MASFIEDLWTSVFTPGPTPTLLIATNAAFAALQAVLFALLIATYSIHFAILSFLTAGLWWAINWFAAELRAAQAKEEEAKRIRESEKERRSPKPDQKTPVGRGEGESEGMDSGDDTEVDNDAEEKHGSKRPSGHDELLRPLPTPPSGRIESRQAPLGGLQMSPESSGMATGYVGMTSLEPFGDDASRKRGSVSGSQSGMSTDSEWEKVEGDR
ncbi:hypothetical protein W97_08154 [Coniosporium apollinis CBS 100218]|uniref:Pkr1-domain-containing protein n=1 Tax=Coniosporium apollinis (strain CBS 100218) TaxID=1168221 RepID=R7Z4M4_CONA1|nr:uncharacterized protein W97_08154 [Coniosporium apollinis CBS 100218]EON68896.1 hypothetical protein W97_08154 [Coniosporium apollinis CBS 100218]